MTKLDCIPLLRARPRAFTLIEMLAVMAVMVTLAALCIPGVSSGLAGMKITTATQIVVDEIQVARATALARNSPVEVWFLKNSGPYESLRTAIVNPDNSSTWVSRGRKLPEGIAFASRQKYSNVIGAQNAGAPPESPAGTTGVRLRVFPSGRLELVDVAQNANHVGPNDLLYLTVTSSAGFDPDGENALPPNFATVQINPLNTRLITHRP